jgi:coenzyme F420-reducing hydrogenase gamma subunit
VRKTADGHFGSAASVAHGGKECYLQTISRRVFYLQKVDVLTFLALPTCGNILYSLPCDLMDTKQTLHKTSGTGQRNGLVVGWFSFTCCEDSTILFTELLNDHLDRWKKVIDFRYIKALKTNNSLFGLDVAFIEGAISSESQAKEIRRIRENSEYVVAIGACACTGQPSTSRNRFASEQINERIRWYLSHFDYGKEVKKLNEVIEVDDMVRGCPMKAPSFLQTLNKYLELFGIVEHAS